MKNKKEQVLQLWNEGLAVSQICKKLNMKDSNVSTLLTKSLGPGRKGRFLYTRRVFSINENFFEKINCEESAYFLGLLCADGHLVKSQSSVKISLHEKDKELLEIFRVKMNYTKPLYINKKIKEKGWNRSDQYMLEFSSTKMRKDLENHGLTSNKTKNLTFPNLDNSIVHHFIRGYFDGDGCISVTKNGAEIAIASTELFNKTLQSKLNEFGIQTKVYLNSAKNCYYLRSTKIQTLITFYNFLYKDATIFLKRKKEKFDGWIKFRENLKNKTS